MTTNWKINPSEYHTHAKFNFYLAPACSNNKFFGELDCCAKYICRRDCNFIIKCEKCGKNSEVDLDHTEDQPGWNPVEGLQEFIFECLNCKILNTKKLAWNSEEHPMTLNNIV